MCSGRRSCQGPFRHRGQGPGPGALCLGTGIPEAAWCCIRRCHLPPAKLLDTQCGLGEAALPSLGSQAPFPTTTFKKRNSRPRWWDEAGQRPAWVYSCCEVEVESPALVPPQSAVQPGHGTPEATGLLLACLGLPTGGGRGPTGPGQSDNHLGVRRGLGPEWNS